MPLHRIPRAGPPVAACLLTVVIALPACTLLKPVRSEYEDQFQVNPVSTRTDAKSRTGGIAPVGADKSPANTPVYPFNLDEGTLPGTSGRAACLATKSTIYRNRLGEYLLNISDQACAQHKARIYAHAATIQGSFSGLSTILGGLGAIVTGEGAARALSGSASISSGLGSNISETFYGNFLAPAIVKQIDTQRGAKLQTIRTQESRSLAEYPPEAMLRDITEYHELCSFYAGVSGLTEDKKRAPTQEELVGRIQMLRTQMLANDELASRNGSSPQTQEALHAANTAAGEQIRAAMQQFTAGLPGGMTIIVPNTNGTSRNPADPLPATPAGNGTSQVEGNSTRSIPAAAPAADIVEATALDVAELECR